TAAVTTTTPAAAVTSTTPAAAVTTTAPPSSSEGTLGVQFSLNQTFNSNLSNPSSSEFKTLAAKVESNVNKAYAGTPGFNRSIVNSFRSGSVVTDMTLVFDKQSSVPSSSSAQAILTTNSTSLNILPGSIRVVVTTTTPAAAVTTTTPAAAVTTTTPAAAVTSCHHHCCCRIN
ncbi:cell wall protein DAN4, partial [Salmo trutta]|uniref:cell wall protein DAN4 n=1 Tax=Salmo trutta TaxID=8032 RepID=UPI0011308364